MTALGFYNACDGCIFPTRETLGIKGAMFTILKLLLCVMLALPFLAQDVHAQALQAAPTKGTGTVPRASASLATNAVGISGSKGETIRVAGVNSNAMNFSKGGSMIIPEPGGRATYIRTTSDGGVMIREPGLSSVTTISPVSDGGMVIMGRDRRPIFVTPDGSVRSFGHDNKSSRVITSSDGSRVTVWGREGRTYTVPMPED